jgi:uncharacterized protein
MLPSSGIQQLWSKMMSVKFDVAQLLNSPHGNTAEYQIEENANAIARGILLTTPLIGNATFVPTADGVLVLGHLKTWADLSCPRCLDTYVTGIDPHIEEEYHPAAGSSVGETIERQLDENKGILIDKSYTMDLQEVVRQHLLLAVPMRPVCRLDCTGLCPCCGRNLNQEACEYSGSSVDPRLAGLATPLEGIATEERN